MEVQEVLGYVTSMLRSLGWLGYISAGVVIYLTISLVRLLLSSKD